MGLSGATLSFNLRAVFLRAKVLSYMKRELYGCESAGDKTGYKI